VGFVVVREDAVVKGTNDEGAPALGQCREDRVRIRLRVHDVDRAGLVAHEGLGIVDAVEPAGPLPSALTWGPILVADRFVEAKDRLQRSESERHSLTIRSDHQRKVPEEALARMDQPTKSLALGITWELELGRVVNDQHAPVLRCAASRLPKVGRQDGLGRHAVIAKKPIRGFQLSVVQRLRKALAWPFSELIS
jgi:hypothetical protein